jgi:hypothetical protein
MTGNKEIINKSDCNQRKICFYKYSMFPKKYPPRGIYKSRIIRQYCYTIKNWNKAFSLIPATKGENVRNNGNKSSYIIAGGPCFL